MSTTTRPLVDGSGRRFEPGRLLGKGGEGAVYDIIGVPGLVAKIYHQKLSPARADKIRAMAAMVSPDLEKFCAWPRGILHSGNEPRGILMPHVAGRKELHMLHGPKSRKKEFPDAGFDFLVHVALNVARAFAQLHARGVIVGDVNDRGFLVGADGTVRVIDCDSFQISGHECGVGVPEYTPPELQGLSLSGLTRTENQDLFGLAVLIFRLLFMGRHPFAGRFEGGHKEIHEAIRESRYAYARDTARTRMRPPPNMLGVAEGAGARIADLFERAFDAAPAKVSRPSARDWVTALGALKSDLGACRFNATHAYVRAHPSCPWCELEQRYGVDFFHFVPAGADAAQGIDVEAIWQAIGALKAPTVPRPLSESAVQVQPTATPTALAKLHSEAADLSAEAARARNAAELVARDAEDKEEAAEQLLSDLAAGNAEVEYIEGRVKRLEAPEPRHPLHYVLIGLNIFVVGASLVLSSAPLLVLGAACLAAMSGTDLIVGRVRGWTLKRLRLRLRDLRHEVVEADPTTKERLDEARHVADVARAEARRTTAVGDALKAAAAHASSCLEAETRIEVDARDQRVTAAEARVRAARAALSELTKESQALQSVIQDRRKRLSGSRLALTNLTRQRDTAYKKLREQERSAQLDRFLDAHYISSADIKGITRGLKSALASFGIETAADISERAVLNVPGFGKVRTQRMVDWRHHVARRFRYQPGREVDPAERKKIEGRYVSGMLRIARDFSTAQTELERRIGELSAKIPPAKRTADDAVRALAQARADRNALNC
jgi:DNA-binding helix-hairpin-helix protein with protein kinase domain